MTETNKVHLIVKKCGNHTKIKTEKIKSGVFEVDSP